MEKKYLYEIVLIKSNGQLKQESEWDTLDQAIKRASYLAMDLYENGEHKKFGHTSINIFKSYYDEHDEQCECEELFSIEVWKRF